VRIRVPGTSELRRHDPVTVEAAHRRAVAFPAGPEAHLDGERAGAAGPEEVALLPMPR
jgi:hypothetical protein